MTSLPLLRRLWIVLAIALSVRAAADVSGYTMSAPVAGPGLYTPITFGNVHGILHTDDQAILAVPIGFDFVFDGQMTDTIGVSSDGVLYMDLNATGTAAANDLDGGVGPNARRLIAPLWDDLDGCGGGASFSTKVEGPAPERVFIAQWDKWHWNATAGDTISFQVKLYETSGIIEFIYKAGPNAPVNASASVGLSGAAAGNFLSVSQLSTAGTASSVTSTDTISSMGATELQLAFYPPITDPNFNPTITGSTGTSFTVEWTPSPSATHRGTAIYITEGIEAPRPVAIVPPSTTSYTITDLGWSSDYEVTLSAFGDGHVDHDYLGAATPAGTAEEWYFVGGTSAADSLTGALAEIATLGPSGPTTILLMPGYTTAHESLPIVVPDVFGHGSGLTIMPDTGAENISISSATYPTIHLDSCKYVTIDGRPGGIGTDINGMPLPSNLTFDNTSTASQDFTGTILISGDARHNHIAYCHLKGSNPSTSGGVVNIVMDEPSTITGCDNNAVSYCHIQSGASFAATGAVVAGTTGSFTPSGPFRYRQLSSRNGLYYCYVTDIFSTTGPSTAVRFLEGTTQAEITGVFVFQTAERHPVTEVELTGFEVRGQSPQYLYACAFGPNVLDTNDPYSEIGGAHRIVGYRLHPSVGLEPTDIKFCYLGAMTSTTSSLGEPESGVLTGFLFGGNSSFHVDNNQMDTVFVSATGGPNCYVAGLNFGATPGVGGTLNSIGVHRNRFFAMGIMNSVVGGKVATYGIVDRTDMSGMAQSVAVPVALTENVMGGAAQVIYAGRNEFAAGDCTLYGICMERASRVSSPGGQLYDYTGDLEIAHNRITYLTNDIWNLDGPISGVLRAISVGRFGSTTMKQLATIQINLTATIIGGDNEGGKESDAGVIAISNCSPVSGQILNSNHVYEMAVASGEPGAASIIGIYAGGGAGLPSLSISGNWVHTMTNLSPNVQAQMTGIHFDQVNATVQNNMITLGWEMFQQYVRNGNMTMTGIRDSGMSTASRIEHNTVATIGTLVETGASNTFAYLREQDVPSGSLLVRNNIFGVLRFNSTGTGKHFGAVLQSMNNVTLSDNLYYHEGRAGQAVGGIGGDNPTPSTTLAAWQAATSSEVGSRFGDPRFQQITGGNLHINPSDPSIVESLTAAAGLAFYDFDGQDRTSFSPSNVDIGADSGAFDTTGATLSMTSTVGEPTTYVVIPVTATFSQEVVGFTSGDVSVSGTANPTISNFAGSGSVYTFDITRTALGTVLADVSAGASTDTSGNPTGGNLFTRNVIIPVELSAFTLE